MVVRRVLAAVVPLLLVAGCAPKQDAAPARDTAVPAFAPVSDDATGARQAIDSITASFTAALHRGDADALASSYAADAIVMSPNEKAMRGRDAIHKGFADFLSQVSIKDVKFTTEDVIVRGDIAVETGHVEWTVQPKKGPGEKDDQKYVSVWQRDSTGSWKMIRDIFNSNLPMKK